MTRLTRFALTAWLVLLVFDGVFRYVCTQLNLPWLAYVKDVLLLSFLGVSAISMAGRLRLYPVILTACGIIVYGALIGLLLGTSPTAVAFGVKMFLPFVAGYVAMAGGYTDSQYFVRLYRWIAPCIVLGVILDVAFTLPWEGWSYDFAGVTIEGSRQWSTFGLQRPAGFGRSSFETAIALYTLLVFRVLAPGNNARIRHSIASKAYDVFLGVVTVAALILTTSKTSLLALGMLGITALLVFGIRQRGLVNYVSRISLPLLMLALLTLTLAPFVIPADAASHLDDELSEYGLVAKLVFRSLVERAQDVWPRAIASVSGSMTAVTGRGIGGVGAPQLYFAPAQYNPADNVHVYLWLSFGAVILALIVTYLLVLIYRLARSAQPDASLAVFLATLLTFGCTMNVIEAPMLMMGLGVLLAAHGRAWNGH